MPKFACNKVSFSSVPKQDILIYDETVNSDWFILEDKFASVNTLYTGMAFSGTYSIYVSFTFPLHLGMPPFRNLVRNDIMSSCSCSTSISIFHNWIHFHSILPSSE